MNKDSYNIDDILSEVKKRREENERALRNEDRELSLSQEEDYGEDTDAEDSLELEEQEEIPEKIKAEYEIVDDVDDVENSTDDEEQDSDNDTDDAQQEEEEYPLDMVDLLQFSSKKEEKLPESQEDKPVKEKFFSSNSSRRKNTIPSRK